MDNRKTDRVAPDRTSWMTAIAATLLIMLVSMDLFMMPIATSALVKEFNTDAGMVQGVVSLFALLLAALTILGGKLGDILGKKKVFMTGIGLYGVAAAVTALAPNTLFLTTGFSIIRSVAVALAVPASVSLIIASYTDEDQRGQAFAMYGVGAMTAGLVAPLLMGLMADKVSWRVPFGLEVLIALAAIVLSRQITETPKVKTKVDGVGTVLAFFSFGAIVLGGMLGGPYGWWNMRRPFKVAGMALNPLDLSPAALLFLIGVVGMVLLTSHVNRREEQKAPALFSMKLFDNRTYAVTTLMVVVFFLLNGALPFVVPVFLQEAVKFDGSKTGMVMATFMIGALIASLGSGRLLARLQPRVLMQMALLVIVAGFFWLSFVVSPRLTVLTVAFPMFVVGLGFGTVFAQVPNIQLSRLPDVLQGEGSGLAETCKGVGVGLGTSLIGSVMFGLALSGMVDTVALQTQVELSPKERSTLILQIEDDTVPHEVEQFVSERVPNLKQIMQTAYVKAFQTTLGVLTGIVLLALIVASFIPNLRTENNEKKIGVIVAPIKRPLSIENTSPSQKMMSFFAGSVSSLE
jgi:MFS family permease